MPRSDGMLQTLLMHGKWKCINQQERSRLPSTLKTAFVYIHTHAGCVFKVFKSLSDRHYGKAPSWYLFPFQGIHLKIECCTSSIPQYKELCKLSGIVLVLYRRRTAILSRFIYREYFKRGWNIPYTGYMSPTRHHSHSSPTENTRNTERMTYAQLGKITLSELKRFDGSDPTVPVCVAIRGKVYNVTNAMNFYGPGGPYAVFAGKDASRGLAKMSTKADEVSGPTEDLSEKEMNTLLDWEKKFSDKYPVVGTIVSG